MNYYEELIIRPSPSRLSAPRSPRPEAPGQICARVENVVSSVLTLSSACCPACCYGLQQLKKVPVSNRVDDEHEQVQASKLKITVEFKIMVP